MLRPRSPGHLLDLGLTEFGKASELQERLHDVRTADLIGDTLILTEHAPVYTLGRTARPEHLGNHGNDRDIDGIPVCRCDRGGSVTYHGPGQLVGYPILRLISYCAGPKAYITLLEETLIRAIAAFGLSGDRRRGLPGVWIADRKIAALGVRISRGVTRHGFALNVMNDLTPFGAIIPCGLPRAGVTSVWHETKGPRLEDVALAVVLAFQEVFGIPLQRANPSEFLAGLEALEDPGRTRVNRNGSLEWSCYSGECHGSA
jgi:lipoyl(octanoyl) transferase